MYDLIFGFHVRKNPYSMITVNLKMFMMSFINVLKTYLKQDNQTCQIKWVDLEDPKVQEDKLPSINSNCLS